MTNFYQYAAYCLRVYLEMQQQKEELGIGFLFDWLPSSLDFNVIEKI